MASSSSSPSSSCTFFDSLPRELLLTILPYLSGFDLLPLSHVNKRFYADLLGPESDQWRSRVPHAVQEAPLRWHALARHGWWWRLRQQKKRTTPESDALMLAAQSCAKRRYFACVSLLFTGNINHDQHTRVGRRRPKRDGIVTPRDLPIRWTWQNTSFSLDVWLALLPDGFSLPPTDGTTPVTATDDAIGGIVFGAQSSLVVHRDGSAVAAQFAHVDPLGNLYCSFITGHKPILATLQLQRWYHLVLTFTKSTSKATNGDQRVYLDGKLLDERHGSLPDFTPLEHVQIGSGFVHSGSVGNLRADYQGKYSFNGLVDEFRFWRGVLSPDDVQRLRRGNEMAVDSRTTCDWSLMRDGDVFHFYGNLSAVRCTRPMEGSCHDIRFAHRVLGVDDPGRPA